MPSSKTDAELQEMFVASRTPELREEVILRYVSLVYFVLGRLGILPYRGVDYEDLVSQGMLGLIEAVDHFDASFGTRISTYATVRIRSRILDYLRDMDWLPRTARQKVRLMQAEMARLETSLHRLPTDEELAAAMNLDMELLLKIQVDSSRVVVSLDETTERDVEENGSLHEWLMDENQIAPAVVMEEKDLQQKLAGVIKVLPERDQMVLSLYYFDDLTFKEIGKTLGISESRVCQIHGRSVASLQTLLGEIPGKQTRANREDGKEAADLQPQHPAGMKPALYHLDRTR